MYPRQRFVAVSPIMFRGCYFDVTLMLLLSEYIEHFNLLFPLSLASLPSLWDMLPCARRWCGISLHNCHKIAI
jgi:hypothetical protein